MSEILKCSGCGAQDWKPINVGNQALFECAYSGNRVIDPYLGQGRDMQGGDVVVPNNKPMKEKVETPIRPEATGSGCADGLFYLLLIAGMTAAATAVVNYEIGNSVYTDTFGNYSIPAIECTDDEQLNLFLVEQSGVDANGYPVYKTVDYESVNPFDINPDYWRTPTPAGDGDLAVVEECQDGLNSKWFYDVPKPQVDQLIAWRLNGGKNEK